MPVETALEALETTCYYLSSDSNRYHFSLHPNLNKILSDRRATVQVSRISERVRAEISKVFSTRLIDVIPFPENSADIPDRPALTLCLLSPDHAVKDVRTRELIETMIRQHGNSGRTFKSALMFAIADDASALMDEGRKVLAWEEVFDERERLDLDSAQQRQLADSLPRARRDMIEAIWRTYRFIGLLSKDNRLQVEDLGLVHASAADSAVSLILSRLKQTDEIVDEVSPGFLLRNWPPAFVEWSTQSVRDAFYASPQFPRLTNPAVVKSCIAKGVSRGVLGYVDKDAEGRYRQFTFGAPTDPADIEFSGSMFIIKQETAEHHRAQQARHLAPEPVSGAMSDSEPTSDAYVNTVPDTKGEPRAATSPTRLTWSGEVPSQRWMNFYTKVLARFASKPGLKLTLTLVVSPQGGLSTQQIEDTRAALRELGLPDRLDTEDA